MTPIYHYIPDKQTMELIREAKALRPINKLGKHLHQDRVNDYAKRAIDKKIPGASTKNTPMETLSCTGNTFMRSFTGPYYSESI